jgi:pimeloyl-ACP methyl ester carboxylesterase
MMETIPSKDGIFIAYQRSGAGPPLILVHGTGGSHVRWASIQPDLEPHFSLYAVDRRGRGESGDAAVYAIEREFEDVAALVEAIGQPVYLLGHSYGGICALEATLLTQHIRKLVLYEPPIPSPGVQIYPEGAIDRLEALLATNKREEVLMTFMSEVVRMPAHELAQSRASPAWPARVAAAHTLPRELRAHERYRFEPDRFKGLTLPTLLLVGGDSPPRFKMAIDTLNATLPNGQVVVLPGQQHIAMDTAPDLFIREVLAFLSECS